MLPGVEICDYGGVALLVSGRIAGELQVLRCVRAGVMIEVTNRAGKPVSCHREAHPEDTMTKPDAPKCVASHAWVTSASPRVMVTTIFNPKECGPSGSRSDPLHDPVLVILEFGKDGFELPAWAWQTLLMFWGELLEERTGADAHRTRMLLQAALRPTSSKKKQDTSWARAVEYVSYMTLLGPVDIAKVENTDHSHSGVIKGPDSPTRRTSRRS